VLATNAGWQPIYTLQVQVRQGDLLRLIGQTQLTIDGAPQIGQQVRLTANGKPVGTQAIEINTQPGSHHLPMLAYGLFQADADGPLGLTLEASSFHSDGDFPVTVDQQDNLAYGSLLAEQYRDYPDLASAWADGALLLTDIHQPLALNQEVWALQPYVQEPLSSLVIPATEGDVLRPSAQAVAVGSFGLEQFTGVLTADGRAISPYGGQNVNPENPQAPQLIEGYDKVSQNGRQFLEHRIYGAFSHGLTILPDSPKFEIAHFGSYGRQLAGFGQNPIQVAALVANSEPVVVFTQEFDLQPGDLLRLTGNIQFSQPDSPQPVTVDCGLQMQVDGPSGAFSSFTRKSLTPSKSVLPLVDFLTVRATAPGLHRLSVKASGRSDAGPIPLRLDGQHSQLQHLHFNLPR
jgi:hypothetical protein